MDPRSTPRAPAASRLLADGVSALLVREAALLLARVEAVHAVLLVRPRRTLLARHAVVEARNVLVVLLRAIRLVLVCRANRVALAAEPLLWSTVCRHRRSSSERGSECKCQQLAARKMLLRLGRTAHGGCMPRWRACYRRSSVPAAGRREEEGRRCREHFDVGDLASPSEIAGGRSRFKAFQARLTAHSLTHSPSQRLTSRLERLLGPPEVERRLDVTALTSAHCCLVALCGIGPLVSNAKADTHG